MWCIGQLNEECIERMEYRDGLEFSIFMTELARRYASAEKIVLVMDNLWTSNDTDARGNVISETIGNGIQTIRGYDTVNGRLDYLQSAAGGVSVQDLNYAWDRVGNLTQRQDARQGIAETFYYDNLHRLTSSTGPDPLGISYDARGNVTSMTGNVDSGGAHTINWYSYNLPSLISGPTGYSSAFFYGPDHSRWKQVASYGGTTETTIYIGGLIEKVTLGGVTSWKHTIASATGPVAVYTRKSSGTNEIHYLTKDHLGSVDSISDASGALEVRLSFGGFGQRRNESGWSGPVPGADWTQITDATRHGFTGHEMLDNLNLIHMNGRVYDQHAGRFISPDPFIDGAGHTQGWNRYSYVKNNPLSFTDPTGFKCYTTCLPTDRTHHVDRTYDFSGVFDNEEGSAEWRGAMIDRAIFMDYFRREYGYDTGSRNHLYLPFLGRAPTYTLPAPVENTPLEAGSTVGGAGNQPSPADVSRSWGDRLSYIRRHLIDATAGLSIGGSLIVGPYGRDFRFGVYGSCCESPDLAVAFTIGRPNEHAPNLSISTSASFGAIAQLELYNVGFDRLRGAGSAINLVTPIASGSAMYPGSFEGDPIGYGVGRGLGWGVSATDTTTYGYGVRDALMQLFDSLEL